MAEWKPAPGRVIVVAGPPASGKGTQCKKLASQLGLIHICTGDIYRDAVARGTELGNGIFEFLREAVAVCERLPWIRLQAVHPFLATV